MHESDLALDLENFVNANTVEAVINLVLSKGNAYLQLYKEKGNPDALVQALKVFKIADHLLTKIREEQAEIQSRLFFGRRMPIVCTSTLWKRRIYKTIFRTLFIFLKKAGRFC